MTLPITYTISSDLRQTLRTIDNLRTHILSHPLSIEEEILRHWDAHLEQIQGSFALAGVRVSTDAIEKDISGQLKQESAIAGYHRMLTTIERHWRAVDKAVPITLIEQFRDEVYVGPFRTYKQNVSRNYPSIRQLLTYLENQTEHPVIHAGIALGVLSANIFPKDDPGLLSRLLATVYLAKAGFDLRGLHAIEQQWAHEASSYATALNAIRIQANLNHWLLFVAQSIEFHFTKLAHALSVPQARKRRPLLTNRQQQIISLLHNPATSITNKVIQKKYKISQITASRDLAMLVHLGIIIAHGRGRSVSYTRI